MILQNVSGKTYLIQNSHIPPIIVLTSPQPFVKPPIRGWRIAYIGTDTYVGVSMLAGSTDTDPVWRIRRINNVTHTVYMTASDLFTCKWSNYATLIYS